MAKNAPRHDCGGGQKQRYTAKNAHRLILRGDSVGILIHKCLQKAVAQSIQEA